MNRRQRAGPADMVPGPTATERAAVVIALRRLARVWARYDRDGAIDFRRLAKVLASGDVEVAP